MFTYTFIDANINGVAIKLKILQILVTFYFSTLQNIVDKQQSGTKLCEHKMSPFKIILAFYWHDIRNVIHGNVIHKQYDFVE